MSKKKYRTGGQTVLDFSKPGPEPKARTDSAPKDRRESSDGIVLAAQARLGGFYLSKKGRKLKLVKRTVDSVDAISLETGNTVTIPLNYPLRPYWETLF